MAYLDTLWFPFTNERLNFFRDLSTILAFAINLLIISTNIRYVHKNVSSKDYKDFFFIFFTEQLINILGIT